MNLSKHRYHFKDIKASKTMTEQELQQYIRQRYPEENARCEWKEMKNLKNFFNGKEGNDVLSYVSAIATWREVNL